MRDSMIIHPDELSKKWIDRLADAGVGVLGIHPCGGGAASESLKALIETIKSAEYRELIDYALSLGLEVEYEFHAAGYLLPRELFSEHPEYFRMDANGNRNADRNFCVSNPDALDLVATRAKNLALLLYGSSNRFYFWMDDGHRLNCHCQRCSKLSPSDQQMLVLNRMLKEIRRHIPDAAMAYLAYMDTVIPPTQISADDGVFLEYAPLEKYTARGEDAAEVIEREKRMIAPLTRFFENAPKKVLEYWYDNSMLSRWKKPPLKFVLNEEAMIADVEEYRGFGFDSVSTFACFLGEDYEELHGGVDITPFAKCIGSENRMRAASEERI